MRPKLVQALRQYYQDTDDATDDPLLVTPLNDGIPYRDPDRLTRLLLRAVREQQQDINGLTARIVALETP